MRHRFLPAFLFFATMATASAQQYQNPLDQPPVSTRARRSSVTTPGSTANRLVPPAYRNRLEERSRIEEIGSGNGRTALDRRPKGVAPLVGDSFAFPAKATPPPQLSPEITRQSTLRAAEKHPDLAVAGSMLNQRFSDSVTILQSSSPEFFQKADWPEQLAERLALEIEKEEARKEEAAKAKRESPEAKPDGK